MSISTISEARPAVVSVKAMVAPTLPAPRMAIFLPFFFMEIPLSSSRVQDGRQAHMRPSIGPAGMRIVIDSARLDP